MRVHIKPSGLDLEVREDETLMGAAERQGYYWPTICRGAGQCTRCYIVVECGWENFVPADAAEQEMLDDIAVFAGPRARLACQAYLTHDAVVTKTGVRLRGGRASRGASVEPASVSGAGAVILPMGSNTNEEN